MKQGTLNRLIQELLDGSISSKDLEQLENELASSESARELYLDAAEIHAMLEQQEPGMAPQQSQVVPMELIVRRQKRRASRIALLAAAAVLLVSLVSMSFFLIDFSPTPSLTFQSAPGSQFTITHDSSKTPGKDGVMEEGSRLQLHQGTVELQFESGVRSIVTAPADITLRTGDHLYMHRGDAWFTVPPKAIGFQVETRDLNIVDLGTEFGVIARPDHYDEVHVFEGKVKATGKGLREGSETLLPGDARRNNPAGQLVEVPHRSRHFPTSLPRSLPYLHWSFDTIENNGFPAAGEDMKLSAAKATPQGQGTKAKELQVQGPFGMGVAFTGQAERGLVTQHPGFDPHTPMTVCYWLKLSEKGLPHAEPQISWAIAESPSRFGRWAFHSIKQGGGKWSHRTSCSGWAQGAANLADGQWHHITTVFTGKQLENKRPEVRHYIDGVLDPVTSSHGDKEYSFTDYSGLFIAQPISIGLDLRMTNGRQNVSRSQIDELYIIQGELNQSQIKTLMETNRLP